ncbi:MAG: putative bifunctional diguanylate cyclase/phosphodiesterase [Lautropia sp.]
MPTSDARQRIAATAFEAHSAMVVTDLRGAIVEANQAFATLAGLPRDELDGRALASVLPADTGVRTPDEIRRSVHLKGYWQGEIVFSRRDGRDVPTLHTITSVRDGEGRVTHFVNAFADISEQKAAEARIRQLAYYDTLTDLPNRRLLLERLSQSLATARRSGLHAALLFLDLDNFKTLNDTLGHERGDELLVQVAQRLRKVLRETDTVARFGGDEFVVLLQQLDAAEPVAVSQVGAVAVKLREALSVPFDIDGDSHHSGATQGISLFGRTEHRAEELLKQADVALNQAKEAGRGAIRFFNPAMQAAIDARARLDSSLRKAVSGDELLLMYQAQVDVAGRLVGAEALVRWRHPLRGIVGPLEFIQHAEESGLIEPIGNWVLEMACRQLAAWSHWPATAALKLSVNISPRQFRNPDFVRTVARILRDSGADPRLLTLELTENVLIDDIDDAIHRMRVLKRVGVNFAIDDFGTGYSSLAYLQRLPVDQLKIDRGFVRDIGADTQEAAITEAIIAMGRTLRLQVIAEGVETAAQHHFLADRGCHGFQGFLFGRPVMSTASLLQLNQPPAPPRAPALRRDARQPALMH